MKITALPEGPACLNVGCGNFYFLEWTNLDLAPAKGVTAHDIRRPLPYPDRSFDEAFVKARMGDQFERYYQGQGKATSARRKGPSVSRQLKQAIRSLAGKRDDPRSTGEAHRWMYDRLSLQQLFQETGFTAFAVKT